MAIPTPQRRTTVLPLASTEASLERVEGKGHADVKTTMIYTHVTRSGSHGVTSPADNL